VPGHRLFDFRVLGRSLMETEFAIIAALQYIRYINDRNSCSRARANLSLSIPHECATTPAAERRSAGSASGWSTAASSWWRRPATGAIRISRPRKAYMRLRAFSITDPGNADGVITVARRTGIGRTPMA
jgi:hypothetical protein